MDRKLVVITGASSGIGEAFARRLAPGHDLLLVARRKERLASLADEFLNKFGTQTEIRQSDLSNPAEIDQLAAELRARDDIALLVNNAGFGLFGQCTELDRAAQLGIIDVNIRALTDLSLRFARTLI
jgi:short-subunit dehydrogenase